MAEITFRFHSGSGPDLTIDSSQLLYYTGYASGNNESRIFWFNNSDVLQAGPYNIRALSTDDEAILNNEPSLTAYPQNTWFNEKAIIFSEFIGNIQTTRNVYKNPVTGNFMFTDNRRFFGPRQQDVHDRLVELAQASAIGLASYTQRIAHLESTVKSLLDEVGSQSYDLAEVRNDFYNQR